jgi:hypothetical protein
MAGANEREEERSRVARAQIYIIPLLSLHDTPETKDPTMIN